MTTITDTTPDVAEDTRYVIAAYILRAYPNASYARWDDLRGGYAPLETRWCVLTHHDGYGVHAVLDNGTLGALIERVRI